MSDVKNNMEQIADTAGGDVHDSGKFTPDGRSLIELLDERAQRFRERTCFIYRDVPTNYGQVMDLSKRIGSGLVAAGITKGMRGAVFSPNHPDGFCATLAIIRAGAIWVPINPRNSIEDNAAVISRFGCDALFYHSAFEDALPRIVEAAGGSLRSLVCIDREGTNAPSLADWAADFPAKDPDVPVTPTDVVSIPMTGGTTGVPKAVALSNRNFNALLHGSELSAGDYKPVNLMAAPMTHVGGRIALTVMFRGGTTVVLPALDPQTVLHQIEKHRVTDVFLPPTAVYMLLDEPNLENFDLSSLRNIGYGSAPMSLEKLKEAIRRIGPVMRGGFGQTECPMMITSFPPDEHLASASLADDARLRSVGRETALSRIAIMGDDGTLLPPGEVGEVVVRGPMVCEGYFENPEATRAIRRNGWHLTGDIGMLNDEGYLTLVDRKKDMIITGGFNVYSAEVERALSTIKGIRDTVVIGVPDAKWGEAVKAVVTLDEGAALSAETIMARAKEMLGSVKAPKSVDFVDNLPRTANAKVDKKAVRSRYWQAESRVI